MARERKHYKLRYVVPNRLRVKLIPWKFSVSLLTHIRNTGSIIHRRHHRLHYSHKRPHCRTRYPAISRPTAQLAFHKQTQHLLNKIHNYTYELGSQIRTCSTHLNEQSQNSTHSYFDNFLCHFWYTSYVQPRHQHRTENHTTSQYFWNSSTVILRSQQGSHKHFIHNTIPTEGHTLTHTD